MFLDLMRKHLKPKEVNDALTKVVQKSPPDFDTSDDGKILGVDGDGNLLWRNETQYIPPAYSTQEVNTGQKWIDGKDIYLYTFIGTTPNDVTRTELLVSYDTLINVYGYVKTDGNTFVGATNSLAIYGLADKTGLSYRSADNTKNQPYNIVVEYTKPDTALTNETKTNKKGR